MRTGMSVAPVGSVADLHLGLLLFREFPTGVGGNEFLADLFGDTERALAGGGSVHRPPLRLADRGHSNLNDVGNYISSSDYGLPRAIDCVIDRAAEGAGAGDGPAHVISLGQPEQGGTVVDVGLSVGDGDGDCR